MMIPVTEPDLDSASLAQTVIHSSVSALNSMKRKTRNGKTLFAKYEMMQCITTQNCQTEQCASSEVTNSLRIYAMTSCFVYKVNRGL